MKGLLSLGVALLLGAAMVAFVARHGLGPRATDEAALMKDGNIHSHADRARSLISRHHYKGPLQSTDEEDSIVEVPDMVFERDGDASPAASFLKKDKKKATLEVIERDDGKDKDKDADTKDKDNKDAKDGGDSSGGGDAEWQLKKGMSISTDGKGSIVTDPKSEASGYCRESFCPKCSNTFAIDRPPATTLEECQQSCQYDAVCKGISFFPDELVDTANRKPKCIKYLNEKDLVVDGYRPRDGWKCYGKKPPEPVEPPPVDDPDDPSFSAVGKGYCRITSCASCAMSSQDLALMTQPVCVEGDPMKECKNLCKEEDDCMGIGIGPHGTCTSMRCYIYKTSNDKVIGGVRKVDSWTCHRFDRSKLGLAAPPKALNCSDSIDCNGKGTASGEPGNCECKCKSGFKGKHCKIPVPPPPVRCNVEDHAQIYCSGHGMPIGTVPHCECECARGWQGRDCSQVKAGPSDDYCVDNAAVSMVDGKEVPSLWHDTGGEQYNCAWYAGCDTSHPDYQCESQLCDSEEKDCDRARSVPKDSNCGAYGSKFAVDDKTANDMCCVCGGGSMKFKVAEKLPPSKPVTTISDPTNPDGSIPFYWGCVVKTESVDYERLRRDFSDLTAVEKALYFEALRELYKSGQYEVFVRIHADMYNKAYSHGTSGFLPWHRKFLLEFENALRGLEVLVGNNPVPQRKYKCVTIPYWDWAQYDEEHSRSDSWLVEKSAGKQALLEAFGGKGDAEPSLFPNSFSHPAGDDEAGCVPNAPFFDCKVPGGCTSEDNRWDMRLWDGHSKNTKGAPDIKRMCLSRSKHMTKKIDGKKQNEFSGHWELMDAISGNPNYKTMAPKLEGMPHAMPHNNLRGHMRSFLSPADPVFFSHHAYLDKIWSLWQDCFDYDIVDYRYKASVEYRHYAPSACKENMVWEESNRVVCERKGRQITRNAIKHKIKGRKTSGKLPFGHQRIPWMSDEPNIEMPFWYPAKVYGEGPRAIDMCDSAQLEAIQKLIPTWNVDDCVPRKYLSAKFTPQSYNYFPDEFDVYLKEHSDSASVGNSGLCTFEPPRPPAALTLSLEQQYATYGSSMHGSKEDPMDLERVGDDSKIIDLEKHFTMELERKIEQIPDKKKELMKKELESFSACNGATSANNLHKCIKQALLRECEEKVGLAHIGEYNHLPETAFMGLSCNAMSCDSTIQVPQCDDPSEPCETYETLTLEDTQLPCDEDQCLDSCISLLTGNDVQPPSEPDVDMGNTPTDESAKDAPNVDVRPDDTSCPDVSEALDKKAACEAVDGCHMVEATNPHDKNGIYFSSTSEEPICSRDVDAGLKTAKTYDPDEKRPGAIFPRDGKPCKSADC